MNDSVAIRKLFSVDRAHVVIDLFEIPTKSQCEWMQTTLKDLSDGNYVPPKPRGSQAEHSNTRGSHARGPSQIITELPELVNHGSNEWIRNQITSSSIEILPLISRLNAASPRFWNAEDEGCNHLAKEYLIKMILESRGIDPLKFAWNSSSELQTKPIDPESRMLSGTMFGGDRNVKLVEMKADQLPTRTLYLFGELVEDAVSKYYTVDNGKWDRLGKLMQLNDAGTSYLIALQNEDEILGFLQWEISEITEDLPDLGIFVLEIALRDDARSKGIGTLLMRAVEYLGNRLGCHRSDLVVQRSNVRALAFYRKMGYGLSDVHTSLHRIPRTTKAFSSITEFHLRKHLSRTSLDRPNPRPLPVPPPIPASSERGYPSETRGSRIRSNHRRDRGNFETKGGAQIGKKKKEARS